MARQSFYYYPAASLADARTFCLDWNVASQLCRVYAGQHFDKEPHLRERLLDLESKFPANGRVIAGFASAEPEARPALAEFDSERLVKRTAEATAVMEQGHGRMADFLEGVTSPATVLTLPENPFSDANPLAFAEAWVRPGYAVLLKAIVLAAGQADRSEAVRKFKFWMNHELNYCPSREAWLGMLWIAGNGKGRALSADLMKLGTDRDATGRCRDLWGASWDVFYTRLVGFGQKGDLLREYPRPFVLVTDDARLHDALGRVELLATTRAGNGAQLGLDYVPLEGLIIDDLRADVEAALDELSQGVAKRNRGAAANRSRIMSKAKSESRRLERALQQLDSSQ